MLDSRVNANERFCGRDRRLTMPTVFADSGFINGYY